MDRVEELKSLLSEIPPRWEEAEKLLSSAAFTEDELAAVAIKIADDCFDEWLDANDPKVEDVTLDRMPHSEHLVETLRILLAHGLDPNTIVGVDNVMWSVQWVKRPNVAASALRLLLAHGGDPNLRLPNEFETLFECVDFKVSYDCYSHEHENVVQCWLVLIAYGARLHDGSLPLTMLNGRDVEIFRSFEDYDYTIEPLPKVPGKSGNWVMHIFRRDSGEEVAKYE